MIGADPTRMYNPGAVSNGCVSLLVALLLLSWPAQDRPQILAPYIATPEDVVERMLALAKVGPADVVYNLGCGDGRMPMRPR